MRFSDTKCDTSVASVEFPNAPILLFCSVASWWLQAFLSFFLVSLALIPTAQVMPFLVYVRWFRLTASFLLMLEAARHFKLSMPGAPTQKGCGARWRQFSLTSENSKTPSVPLQWIAKRKYDLGKFTTDNALFELADVMGRCARTIAFLLFSRWRFTFSFARSIFHTKLLQQSDLCNKCFHRSHRVCYKGIWLYWNGVWFF